MHDDPRVILKKHGKTFNFARLFLGSKTGMAAARLYRFCRVVDDIADDSDDKGLARLQLEEFSQVIINNQKEHAIVGDFLHLCEEFNIDRANGVTLIDGVTQDLEFEALQSEEALIQYAYKVAGVVGLMMAPILGSHKDGLRFAIDLGIGMQLTNIARDVLEDSLMGRRYIPGDWVNNLSAKDISQARNLDAKNVQTAISRLLDLAEAYYNSGLAGLYYLPHRNRQAIAVAAYSYREIGRKIINSGHQYFDGRVVLSKTQKIKLAGKALWHLNTGQFAAKPLQHSVQLHYHLRQYQTELSRNSSLLTPQ